MDQIRQIAKAKAKFDSLGGKSIDQDITGDNNGASNNSNNSGGSNAGTGTNNRGVSNNNQKSADNAASLVQGCNAKASRITSPTPITPTRWWD